MTAHHDLAKQVTKFHEKFGLLGSIKPCLPKLEIFEFKLGHIQEELDEVVRAYAKKDLVEFADGLIDLVYVVLGMSHFAGIPFNEIFQMVHEANMKKKRAKKKSDSKRGSKLDIVKPEGWKKPDVAKILREHGAKV
jgi:predicted HAD superfamily Cof-like phosphohydrolase